MTWKLNMRLSAMGAAAVLLAAGATALAQTALAQIAVRDADAREWVQTIVEEGGPNHLVTWDDPQVRQVLATFKKLPAGAKGPLTTQLYAWAKGVLAAPAFKARYLKTREERKPQARPHPGTVDDEVKTRLAKYDADAAESIKAAEAKGMKDLAAQMRKQMADMRAQQLQFTKLDVLEQRAKDKADYDSGMEAWTKLYPPDPQTVIANALRDFIASTADVDFAAKQHVVQGEGGSSLGFVNAAYVKKPWQWKFAYEWGPEAIAAARTAAAAWLKELGK